MLRNVSHGISELLGIGSLCASNAPVVGVRYLILTLVCVGSIATQLVFLYELILINNTACALLVFSVYIFIVMSLFVAVMRLHELSHELLHELFDIWIS